MAVKPMDFRDLSLETQSEGSKRRYSTLEARIETGLFLIVSARVSHEMRDKGLLLQYSSFK